MFQLLNKKGNYSDLWMGVDLASSNYASSLLPDYSFLESWMNNLLFVTLDWKGFGRVTHNLVRSWWYRGQLLEHICDHCSLGLTRKKKISKKLKAILLPHYTKLKWRELSIFTKRTLQMKPNGSSKTLRPRTKRESTTTTTRKTSSMPKRNVWAMLILYKRRKRCWHSESNYLFTQVFIERSFKQTQWLTQFVM